MSPERLNRVLQQALAHHREGRLAEAEALYRQVQMMAPRNFDALHLSGLLAHQQGRVADAVDLLARALKIDPRSEACEVRLGNALIAQGRPAKAEERFRAVLGRQPGQAEGWEGLALCLKLQDRLIDAIACHRKVVALRPSDAIGWCNFGLTFSSLGRIAEGLACFERAIGVDAECVAARFGRAQGLFRGFRIQEAIAEYDRVLARCPGHLEALSYRLVALHYVDGISREQLLEEHVAYGRTLPAAQPEVGRDFDPGRKLRVAFLSPDFRSHSCAFFIEPLLRHLDRSQFEIILYHDHFRTDAVSARLREQASIWRNFVGVSPAEVERTIRSDAPDILVDLAGHFCMTNRLPLFARRLAPVQLSYLGYPDTTGVSAMDYRFTDGFADPQGEADRFATERLVRFAPTAWAYQPPVDAPDIDASTRTAPVTFGSFNDPGKLSDSVLRNWSRILQAVAGSRLLLKGAGIENPGTKGYLLDRIRAAGIDPSRVELLERTPSVREHLALYNRIDIALDTFPYHGTTTTCEALWMGVPVVSLRGDRHVSRVGVSLLAAVGHSEWVAEDPEAYVRIATGLVSDRAALGALRSSLRSDVGRSPLLDHRAQAELFGQALRSCWAAACGNRKQAA
ncbi:MAG TPA: tetratricopeptide repeat protein [Opitutaceae bacterium]|jgi:predicted O-linked N-acetylglucosamine transferase (SPINDLY family)